MIINKRLDQSLLASRKAQAQVVGIIDNKVIMTRITLTANYLFEKYEQNIDQRQSKLCIKEC
ncbi:hypothetical protein ViNHUV68_08690 [Vibrio sp. NH-UV-68]